MNDKQNKELQEIQISYFNDLTMSGKKCLMDIMASASILRLNEHKQVELTQSQREAHYDNIFNSVSHYREIIDENLLSMRKIIIEIDELED